MAIDVHESWKNECICVGKSGWRSEHQSRLSPLLQNVVCGLSFSRSQPDFEGFLRALRFPPSSKLSLSFFKHVICNKQIITS